MWLKLSQHEHIKPLDSALQKIATEELSEVPSRIAEDLESFKLWIEQQPHLKARTDDQFLIQFLRGCKYSMERAKVKIDLYYTLKTKFPQMFGVYDVDDRQLRRMCRLGCFLPLPQPLHDNGCRLVVSHFNYNTNDFTMEEVIHPGIATTELFTIDDPHACISGIICIIDMSKVTMAHLLQASPLFLKTTVTYVEKSLPLRIKAIYFVNVPLSYAPTLEELKQHIPLKYLPEYYGGANGSMEDHIKAMDAKLDEYREYFKENAKYGTDESLRLGKSSAGDDLFGCGGSFRKLEVD
uniref:CRAL-TRIO domain-containing protein n=1 Tax=Musca domestica TaxID=7370 RepID=A0A1I8MTM3_MUSDO